MGKLWKCRPWHMGPSQSYLFSLDLKYITKMQKVRNSRESYICRDCKKVFPFSGALEPAALCAWAELWDLVLISDSLTVVTGPVVRYSFDFGSLCTAWKPSCFTSSSKKSTSCHKFCISLKQLMWTFVV